VPKKIIQPIHRVVQVPRDEGPAASQPQRQGREVEPGRGRGEGGTTFARSLLETRRTSSTTSQYEDECFGNFLALVQFSGKVCVKNALTLQLEVLNNIELTLLKLYLSQKCKLTKCHGTAGGLRRVLYVSYQLYSFS